MRSTRARRRTLVGLLAVALMLALAACMTSEQTRVADALNRDRTAQGRRALPTHDALNRKAQAWAEKLARDGRLSHSRLTDGVPACYRAIGENVGYDTSIERVEAGYMRSPGHRANILDPKWDLIGVGAARAGDRWYTVQVFLQGCT